jgi:predicted nucleic acid-binding protein
MVIIDTSIIIDHLRQPFAKSKLAELIQKQLELELAISLISIQELYEGQSTRDSQKESQLITTLAGLKILPYTFDIAKRAGTIARDSKYPLAFPDAAIAATAISHHANLYTLNTKHFQDIPHLTLHQP